MEIELNKFALESTRRMTECAERLNISVSKADHGTQLVDCGVVAEGGLEAGIWMAKACLAGLGDIEIGAGDCQLWPGPWVIVRTDQPTAACMASQYAGWPVTYDDGENKYFAMASGPMRAARGREPLFDTIGYTERPAQVLGILESGKLPSLAVCCEIAEQCHVQPDDLTLLVAPTSSIAGTVQVVARSVETALHKMLELKFDLRQIVAGFGRAPLPPVTANDLDGIGRTNDAILYGAHVTLWVRSNDELLESLGDQVPSSSSRDYGKPFAEIFREYDHDFYRIDPLLFSPAVVELLNLSSGRVFRFGRTDAAVLRKSFGN